MCNKCKEDKPKTEEFFYRRIGVITEFYSECKLCFKERAKTYRINNKSKVSESSKRWYKNNTKHMQQYMKEYYKLNRLQRLLYRAKYCKNNPGKLKQTCRKYYLNNIDIFRAGSRRYIAKKHKAEGSHTIEEIKNLLKIQKYRCIACNTNVKISGYHIDHIIALAKGGSDYISNIQILCPACNLSKQDKTMFEFMQRRDLLLSI